MYRNMFLFFYSEHNCIFIVFSILKLFCSVLVFILHCCPFSFPIINFVPILIALFILVTFTLTYSHQVINYTSQHYTRFPLLSVIRHSRGQTRRSQIRRNCSQFQSKSFPQGHVPGMYSCRKLFLLALASYITSCISLSEVNQVKRAHQQH